MRLLFLYAFDPSGHASAAAALENAARDAGHETGRLAVSSSYHPLIGKFVAAIYMGIIRRIPGFWGLLYDHPRIEALVGGLRRAYLLLGGRRMRRTLAVLAPDVVVCTHAAPMGFLIEACSGNGGRPPVAAVLTDFGVHGYWLRPRADFYFAATGEAAEKVLSAGVAGGRVWASGIPIHPVFSQPVDRKALRKALGVDDETAVVFISGGSRGLGRLPQEIRSLLDQLRGVLLLAACGNNAGLRGRLQAAHAGDRRLRVLGYQTPAQMRDLLGACDLFIGKAGGITAAESLAMGVPLVLVDSIPGQEERNAAYLEGKGAALRVEGARELGSRVKALLEEPFRLGAMRAAAQAMRRPAAAREIIDTLAAQVAGRPGHLLY